MDLRSDPELSAQVDQLPPRELVVDGVPRRRNREIPVDEAVRLAARGLRAFVLGWEFGAEVPADRFEEALAAHASRFEQDGPHPPEAWVLVYGRSDPATKRDTRILVACVADFLDGRERR